MENSYLRNWSNRDFIKFVLPSIISLITISLYMTVDAIFVSRYIGPLGLAAVNIVMPLFNLSIGTAIMLAAGSSAIIGIELGKKQVKLANRHFALVFCIGLTAMLAIYLGIWLIGAEKIAKFLGATEALLPYCIEYLSVFSMGLSAVILQLFFEYFIRLDGKPMVALFITIASGLTNIILDYILIVRLDMEIAGAGIASSAGIFMAVVIGLLYFCFFSTHLKPTRPIADLRFIVRSLVNGSSEMITDISSGIKILVFNLIIIQYAGEPGVAVMAIFLNLYFLMSSFHIGLIMGTAPIFSLNYGAGNYSKIRQLTKQSLITSFGASILVFIFCQTQGFRIISLFSKDEAVINMATDGFTIFAFTFLVNGITILTSGFFTAVGNGKISSIIAGMNSIVFTLVFVAILPGYLGLNGVWLSIPIAETFAMLLAVIFFIRLKKLYIAPNVSSQNPKEMKGNIACDGRIA